MKNLIVNRIDKSLPLPDYQTKGAVAFDLYSREDKIIKPNEIVLLPTNLIVKIPAGYFLMIASRSSLPIKRGLMLANGIGIVDQDYCGPEDEIKIQIMNITKKKVKVEKGERIAQAVLVKISRPIFNEQIIKAKNRRGFGSTGR